MEDVACEEVLEFLSHGVLKGELPLGDLRSGTGGTEVNPRT
jgi:hypothetical protein